MATLAERIEKISDLNIDQAEHLRSLCQSWQVLADLSFSDLLLYVRIPPSVGEEEVFQVCAQLRPFTSQTLYPHDMVGTRVTQPEQPIVERAFREGRIWAQDDPVLVDGIPIWMDAVPVRYEGEVIAVMTKEGSPATSRRPGRLEQIYLDAAEHVSQMICDGVFPWADTPAGEWPRVGDGLFVLENAGVVTWASPNALSSLRRLGVAQNVLGKTLDELGLGQTVVRDALHTHLLMDGELVRAANHVLLRVLPLVSNGSNQGALVLAKDVTELRQRERVISVKDATIREIHHRVKNNLQTIASLLRLQGRRLHSEEAKAALAESVLRIGSIALVHETLSEQPSDVAEFGEVARRIARMVGEGLMLPGRSVEIRVEGTAGPLGADIATPLAVTLAELLQNAVEHAFPEGRKGTVSVRLDRRDDWLEMTVTDDGVGIEDAGIEGSRLGLQIVRSLIDELGGSFAISAQNGTTAHIKLPTAGTA
ncbi:MAG TPA: histidine kinase N-terminal domain-containing protein [Actinomycetota bacterium]|nr:histidine kinase N-terminal domain-containing protein [Actinomycetota bacterium]